MYRCAIYLLKFGLRLMLRITGLFNSNNSVRAKRSCNVRCGSMSVTTRREKMTYRAMESFLVVPGSSETKAYEDSETSLDDTRH